MPTYNYINDIPDAPNNPSQDQPNMKINTNSIDSLINEDHYSFEQSNRDGFHRQMRIPEQAAIPAGLITSSGTLYTKAALSLTAATNRSQLFYTNSTSGNEYQLTRVDNAQFSKFGTNTAYVADHTGGWTFLPGGLILMYGERTTSSGAVTIEFPTPFLSGVFSVQAIARKGSSNTTQIGQINSVALDEFTVRMFDSSGTFSIFWTAIGK